MKKIFFIIALFILNFYCLAAANAENFYIKHYDVNIDIDKYKSANITESIDAYFTRSSHGIYRDIPINKTDKITNIRVNEQYTKSVSKNNAHIKIGNPDIYVQNEKYYVISYTYQIRDNKDEFYFNIIGTQWGTDINKATFKITMPSDVDPQKVGVSIGEYGTKGFKDIARYSVNGNVITGETIKNLPPYNGITIRVEVPSGYFLPYEPTFLEKYGNIISIIGILICLFISVLIWFIFGKDKHITPIVSFYPPKNLNSAQVGVIYNEKAMLTHVLSLIPYLASKGYLKIINNGKNFQLKKLKDYDGNNNVEAELMDILFWNKDIVTETSLRKSRTFYTKMQSATKMLSEFKKEIFTLESLGLGKKLGVILCIVVTSLLALLSFSNFSFDILSNDIETLIPLIFVILCITLFSPLLSKSPWPTKIFLIFFCAIFGAGPLLMLNFKEQSTDVIGIIILAVIAVIIECICWVNLPQWTEDARYTKGEILGFRHFLKVAEENRIRELIRENPNYCYDLLPYAYILGVAPELMRIIESLMVPAPNWYDGVFTYTSFHHFSRKLYDSSIPSTENGGVSTSSSGGGGFSGGGHGGGGGGSW